MGLRIYNRRVDFEIAYIPIDTTNTVADLAAALRGFGHEDATWAVEPSYIVLSREMGSTETPSSQEGAS